MGHRCASSPSRETRFLSSAGAVELLSLLSAGEISGGAVYDALVGAAAREHGLALASLDRRAVDTYRVIGAEVFLLASGAQPEQDRRAPETRRG